MVKGQILVELLLALAVAVVTITALAGVATLSISNTGFARHQSQASNLATEVLEWARKDRDTRGWSQFKILNGDYCMASLNWSAIRTPSCDIGNCAAITSTQFHRCLKMDNSSGTHIDATATVYWEEGDKVFSAKQSTQLGGF